MWDLVRNPGDRFSHNEAQSTVGREWLYHKIPKFSDARKLRCNLPKIQTKRPNLRAFYQKDAYGIANSEDPDPLGAV